MNKIVPQNKSHLCKWKATARIIIDKCSTTSNCLAVLPNYHNISEHSTEEGLGALRDQVEPFHFHISLQTQDKRHTRSAPTDAQSMGRYG